VRGQLLRNDIVGSTYPHTSEAASPRHGLNSCLRIPSVMSIEALGEGISDLVRLLRYERRAWSQRKRAVRAFMAIKLNLHGAPPP